MRSTLSLAGDLAFLVEKFPQRLTHTTIGGRKGLFPKLPRSAYRCSISLSGRRYAQLRVISFLWN